MGESFSLTQKYRPTIFKDVLDQDAIVVVLKNLLLKKRFSSPLMFTGIWGGGKTTLARIFARAALCKNLTETGEPCNECFSCQAFLNDSNPAYTEIDAASNSGVDDVRKLREEANFKVLGDYDRKVVVIDECHSISAKGNDALLKQLEDNNTDQLYIFCTTAPEKMHPTVRSRCLEFKLNKNSKESIVTKLTQICDSEKVKYELKGLEIIASMTAPHVRDSLKALEYLSNFGEVTEQVASEHYKLVLENEYLNVISLLKSNLSGALSVIGNLVLQESVPNIYEGIIRNILGILKFKNGINVFRSEDQEDLANYIFENYGDDLSKILEDLLKRNKYVDQLTLESDIIIINKKLNTTFSEEVHVEKVYVEVPTTKVIERVVTEAQSAPKEEVATVIAPEKEKTKEDVVKADTVITKEPDVKIEEPNVEDMNETEAILKRYPSYPPKLAMLMAKSKQKNITLTDKETVELKGKVKDNKKSLPRSEIRDFIDNKIKRT